MKSFSTSLVREKIIFVDEQAARSAGHSVSPTVVRSNRIFLNLEDKNNVEKVVVRTQNMHTTLRLAAQIMQSYYRSGLFLNRADAYDWPARWQTIISAYEAKYNPGIWAAVYINGKSVFKTVKSPFVDVIEQCALSTIDNYDATMGATEEALKQSGKSVRINHSSNVAAVITENGDVVRCGIVQRAEKKGATFSFTVNGGDNRGRIVETLNAAALFLEALNLRYIINSSKHSGVGRGVADPLRIAAARDRVDALVRAISTFEKSHEVRYRPERPTV